MTERNWSQVKTMWQIIFKKGKLTFINCPLNSKYFHLKLTNYLYFYR